MKRLLFLIGFSLFLASCGTVEEAVQTRPPQPQPIPVKQEPQRITFVTKTDTVNTTQSAGGARTIDHSRQQQVRFMVQIGAFKDPSLASNIQATARARYHMPVLNDYLAKLGLYQIRLGFFVRKEDAREFRAKMQKDFPGEYNDSWVVQLKQ